MVVKELLGADPNWEAQQINKHALDVGVANTEEYSCAMVGSVGSIFPIPNDWPDMGTQFGGPQAGSADTLEQVWGSSRSVCQF